MTHPKVVTVFGTRPEAIKMAPLVKMLELDGRFRSVAVSTGQHREMLDQVNAMFGITPDFDLRVMRPGQSLNMILGRTVSGLDQIIEELGPDVLVVQGDTTTAMGAAIAAFNRSVKVVHLEAGLRTGNLSEPFPEEGNRKVVGQIADLHLAPTHQSKNNLLHEGVAASNVVVTGNTVIDALLMARDWDLQFTDHRIDELNRIFDNLVMVTTHRRENIKAMRSIGDALRRLSERFDRTGFVIPAHLNPLVRSAILPAIQDRNNILVTDPLPYGEFIKLMSLSSIILTDSGGVQEEAPSLGKPVLVMRNNTERPEAVRAGTVKLIGTDPRTIFDETCELLENRKAYEKMANAVNPYGDGRAAERSVAAIAGLLGVGARIKDFDSL